MKTPLVFSLLTICLWPARAQTSAKFYTGLGYQEHLSLGATVSLKEKNAFSITYGSNFFYKPQNFSTLHLQYDRQVPSLGFEKFIPGAGVKAGQIIFTDAYYRWRVISVVPFLTLSKKLTPLLELIGEGGVAYARIEEVTRIRYGDIGKYRRYLPEVKISLRHRIITL